MNLVQNYRKKENTIPKFHANQLFHLPWQGCQFETMAVKNHGVVI